MTSDEETKSGDTVVNLDIWRGNNKKYIFVHAWTAWTETAQKKEIRLLHNGRRNIQLADTSHR